MNDFLLVLIGVVIGVLLFFFRGFLISRKAEKVDIKIPSYLSEPFFVKLKDTIRHIVVEYNIRRKNNDFLLNILDGRKIIMQLTHRSHYPEITKDDSDISFGMALYLPISELSVKQREKLLIIMKEESSFFLYEEVPFDYYVIDFGKRIKYCSYLLIRIIREIFGGEDVDFKLFSEGKISYKDAS